MMETRYDLINRTRAFGKQIIILSTNIVRSPVTNPLIIQCVRAGTSVGANYAEANGASSVSDFRNKISLCKKECQETEYWLLMLEDMIKDTFAFQSAKQECHQLILIFNKILKTLNEKYNKRSVN